MNELAFPSLPSPHADNVVVIILKRKNTNLRINKNSMTAVNPGTCHGAVQLAEQEEDW